MAYFLNLNNRIKTKRHLSNDRCRFYLHIKLYDLLEQSTKRLANFNYPAFRSFNFTMLNAK